MISIANTTVTVSRGTETDPETDDTTDTLIPVYAKMPMAITFRNVATSGRMSGQFPRIVREYWGRYPGNRDIMLGDQVIDESTGIIYSVDEFGETKGLVGKQDRTVKLRKIGTTANP